MNISVKYLVLTLFIFLISCTKKVVPIIYDVSSQELITSGHPITLTAFQEELNADYLDPEKSPLSEEQRFWFQEIGGHNYFPVDDKYRIVAQLDTTALAENIQFETTTDRIAVYDLYGIATFQWEGNEVALNIYQSHRLRVMEEYKDHLFLPFTDLTNGAESYGGGRYLDLVLPEGAEIVIDFNEAYSPYCAYSDKYSCPVPPIENSLDFEVKAGVRNMEVIMKK